MTINSISTVQGFPSDLALGMRGDKIAYSASVKSVTESLQDVDVAHAQRTNANLE